MATLPYILIVDDTPANIDVLGAILMPYYEISVAVNGPMALDIVDSGVIPDLVLLDIMMPEMDGYEVCAKLKSSRETKDIPIIFLTAKTSAEDIVKGFEAGGVDYITKPFNSTELLARIRTHLEIMRVGNERKELLHILCHDLANPFASIISILKTITESSKFERFREPLLASADNGMRVIQLVRQMRALEEQGTDFVLQPVNLKKIFDESVFMLKQKFSEKNITLDMDVDNNLMVVAEKTSLLNSVINNIFTNAIKFSFPNSKICVSTSRSGNMTSVLIRDFGIGMSEDLKKNVFNIKKTTTRKGTNEEIGTGFGMPLVKKFVNAYGGNIEIVSWEKRDSEQHGTEVKLSLMSETESGVVS